MLVLADHLRPQLTPRRSHCHLHLLRTNSCCFLSCTKLQCVLSYSTSNMSSFLLCYLSPVLCLLSCHCLSATSSFLRLCCLCYLSNSSSDPCQSPTCLCQSLCRQPAERSLRFAGLLLGLHSLDLLWLPFQSTLARWCHVSCFWLRGLSIPCQ